MLLQLDTKLNVVKGKPICSKFELHKNQNDWLNDAKAKENALGIGWYFFTLHCITTLHLHYSHLINGCNNSNIVRNAIYVINQMQTERPPGHSTLISFTS